MTFEHDGLLSKSFTKLDPMVPEEPITSALNGFGSKPIISLRRFVFKYS